MTDLIGTITDFTLLNIAYKIFAILLNKRLIENIEIKLEDNQMGFHSNRSTVDNIFIIRQIFEKSHEYNTDLYNISVDYTHVFDSVYRNKLIECLKKFEVPNKLIRLIALTLIQTSTSQDKQKSYRIIYSRMQCQIRRPSFSNLV